VLCFSLLLVLFCDFSLFVSVLLYEYYVCVGIVEKLFIVPFVCSLNLMLNTLYNAHHHLIERKIADVVLDNKE
jgi:hypothetical protein